MREQFINWRPSKESHHLINVSNSILDEYERQGYVLTLRQLYYQLVARDFIPNNIKSYNSLGNIISKARLAGFIDWDMIEDRARVAKSRTHWDAPEDILVSAAAQYYRDRWADQSNYIEVWTEKDAVSNIVNRVCRKYDVLFMANRGYSSQSAMHDAYKRINRAFSLGKEVTIIYLGDHDPSGIDMTRDIEDRLGTFLFRRQGEPVNFVERIALNIDQIREYNPPENPAKTTDSRFESYFRKFGESSWELDALEPGVLSDLVESAVLNYLDREKFDQVERVENDHKLLLNKIAGSLDSISDYLAGSAE